MVLDTCPRCSFVWNWCYCNQKEECKVKKIKNKIISWSINRIIHFNLYIEKLKSKIRTKSHLLQCRIKKMSIPKTDRIELSLNIKDFEEILRSCLFSNEKTLIKKIFINTNLSNTIDEIKQKFKRLTTEFIMEFHKSTPLKPIDEDTIDEKLDEILLMKGIQEIKVRKSNIPINKLKKGGKIA